MTINEIASAIINDLFGGNLIPLSNRSLISMEQIEDEVVAERSLIAKEWYLRSQLRPIDLAYAINCIEVDCENQNRCPCKDIPGKSIQHFQIPKLAAGLGRNAIVFVGSTDRSESFRIYYNLESIKYQKYRRRDASRPYVYIEKVPNANGMYDGWIFNAPFVKYISVVAVFEDPRQLEGFNCCEGSEYLDMGPISSELIRRILAKKVSLYRQLPPPTSQITT